MVAEDSLTPQQQQIASMLAEARLSIYEICEQTGLDRSTIWRWRQGRAFAKAVADERAEITTAIRDHGVAIKELRVRALNDRWMKLQRIIDERAADPKWADVPGWKTGLMIHDVKTVGAGDACERVDLFRVDVGLLAELRQHEQDAAKEMGQLKLIVEQRPADARQSPAAMMDWLRECRLPGESKGGTETPIKAT